MVLPGHGDVTYLLLVKVGSLVLTTLLVMITCLRCVSRNRPRVTAGFWRPDCFKKNRRRSGVDEVDAANHTGVRPATSVPRTRPLSDFVTFDRIVRPVGLERSRSNSEIYAYIGKQNLGHYWSNARSNPVQYDVPAYSQILENDGQASEELYSQMHGQEYYDNIKDISPRNVPSNKAAVNSYDYPKFSPLTSRSRQCDTETSTSKQAADSSSFEPHLYSAIRSVSDFDAKDSSTFPLHRSRLSRSHIGICAEPLYSVIQKQRPFAGRTVYVSGRTFPHSDPSIAEIGGALDESSGGPVPPRNAPSELGPPVGGRVISEEAQSCNYRYLSMREPLDVLRRRLEQQGGRNVSSSASDSSLHYYTYINEPSDPGYEAVASTNDGTIGDIEAIVGEPKGPSSILMLPIQQASFASRNSSMRRASNSAGMYDNIRETESNRPASQVVSLTHSPAGQSSKQEWLILNVGRTVTSSSDSDFYSEFDGARMGKNGQGDSPGDP